ncbi:MAG: PorT family protein [Bacteroidetes bacterium]|nr:MAG: PorT family protein [Bacteroidota bacterium]
MKKNILMAAACLLMNYFINAQNTQAKNQTTHVQLGIKAGVNIANIHVEGEDDNNEYDSRTGFHIGGLAHIHLSDHFAVQPEIVYSTEGAEATGVKLKRDYINVPVLVQYMINDGFRLQTGPQVGFLVSAKNEIGDTEVDVKDNVNTVGFAWSFGASYLTKIGVGFDARYNLGITNINENNSIPESRNRVWQIGAFYQFSH